VYSFEIGGLRVFREACGHKPSPIIKHKKLIDSNDVMKIYM
jgi:hypothetical protein